MEKAVGPLTALGLTQYEARVYAALVRAGEAPVGAIHEVSGVPRSAVYGTLGRLESRGLVDRAAGRPARFRAVPAASALQRIREGADRAAADALEELSRLRPRGPARPGSLWYVGGRGTLAGRLPDLLLQARKEVCVIGHASLLDRIRGPLESAAARGVRVLLAVGGGQPRSLAKGAALVRRSRSPWPRMPEKLLMGVLDRRTAFFSARYGAGEEVFVWSDNRPFARFMTHVVCQLGSFRSHMLGRSTSGRARRGR